MALTEEVQGAPIAAPTPVDLSLVMESIDTALDESGGPENPADERYRIQGDSDADWAMRKLAGIRQQMAANTKLASEQTDVILAAIESHLIPIREWLATEEKRLGQSAAFFEFLLEQYHRTVVGEDPKRLSVKLPHGVLESRKKADVWDFDETVFLAWAETHAVDLVKVADPTIDKAQAKKSLVMSSTPDASGRHTCIDPLSGEVVPGVFVTVGERGFTPKPDVN